MKYSSALFAFALGLVAAATTSAHSADLDSKPVKAAAPVPEIPFFFVNDNRLTYAYSPTATYPGATSGTQKQTFAFTHFDVWAYGTNFINLDLSKYGHGSPASPCLAIVGVPNACAGDTEFYGLIRSTFGWNELFDTKAFSIGPLKDISFEVGAEAKTENTFLGGTLRTFMGGLQFSFALPYQGYINFSPMAYQTQSHDAFLQTGSGFIPPGFTGIPDGNLNYSVSWALEANYYMDLGFLPSNLRYFAISGRATIYGRPSGRGASPTEIPSYFETATQIYSEPIRLTFDASKAMWGDKYSHFVDVWVAYRYWSNKYFLNDSNPANPICFNSNGTNNHTCTEETLYTGVTVKF